MFYKFSNSFWFLNWGISFCVYKFIIKSMLITVHQNMKVYVLFKKQSRYKNFYYIDYTHIFIFYNRITRKFTFTQNTFYTLFYTVFYTHHSENCHFTWGILEKKSRQRYDWTGIYEIHMIPGDYKKASKYTKIFNECWDILFYFLNKLSYLIYE